MKVEDTRQKDAMGKLHNKMVGLIDKSELSVSEACMVLDLLKQTLLDSFRKGLK